MDTKCDYAKIPRDPNKVKYPHLFSLIPTLLPEGEGLENPSSSGRGAGVRAGLQITTGHFVRRSK